MTLEIGITGISGRMGQLLAVEAGRLAQLAGGTSRSGAAPPGARLFEDTAQLASCADVVIDFTHPSCVAANAATLAAARKPWVLGTTGYDEAAAGAIAAAANTIAVIASPNFCTGVNLLLILAEKLGATLPASAYDAEILEMHHRQKLDAPSGTALALGTAVAAGRGVALGDVMAAGRHGQAGPRAVGEIGFASLRGGQIIGSHTLTFTAADEQLAFTHHALDRKVFATGAVQAAMWLAAKPPGRYTMRDVLGF